MRQIFRYSQNLRRRGSRKKRFCSSGGKKKGAADRMAVRIRKCPMKGKCYGRAGGLWSGCAKRRMLLVGDAGIDVDDPQRPVRSVGFGSGATKYEEVEEDKGRRFFTFFICTFGGSRLR